MSGSAKAIVAFVVTFLSSLIVLVQDKTEFSDLSGLQWLIAVATAFVSAAAVWAVPNSPSARHEL